MPIYFESVIIYSIICDDEEEQSTDHLRELSALVKRQYDWVLQVASEPECEYFSICGCARYCAMSAAGVQKLGGTAQYASF